MLADGIFKGLLVYWFRLWTCTRTQKHDIKDAVVQMSVQKKYQTGHT